MNGIFLWGTGHRDMAEAFDPAQVRDLPFPWSDDVDAFGPWRDVFFLHEGPGSRCRVSEKRGDAPAIFIAGACSSAMALAWHFCSLGCLPEWGSVLCISQWKGVGQLGRNWESPPGNLYAAVRLPDNVGYGPPAGSLLTGYWVAGVLRELGIPAQLKWPNDLILDERKAGGILIQRRDGVVLAGIGLNLTSAPPVEKLRAPRAMKAVSLSETGHRHTPLQLWCRLMKNGPYCFKESLGLDPLSFNNRLLDFLAFLGRDILVDDHTGALYSGKLIGLSRDGGLNVTVENTRKTIRSGSIYPLDDS